ncbi:hypothetical protein J4763_07055 [Burkholderia pseudomallei]|uniref:hypothetical protein n=1 Tax=Burkholderia pseudomallei TaxID=28450 RepID=UPI001AAF03BD|nr:hypothetical protein [Burkholderia pseudomallei]MBO3056547.1 hypothetical protein [Burkholderia pseudomallei]
MNAKLVRAAVVSTLLLTTSAITLAAAGAGSNPSNPSSPQAREHEHGSMMGGMMGMQGMMGGCPMMGGNMGLDPKTALRMHGEMMRAMGDIMTKYSEQAGTPSSKQ